MQDFFDNSVKKLCFYDDFKYLKKFLKICIFFADVDVLVVEDAEAFARSDAILLGGLVHALPLVEIVVVR